MYGGAREWRAGTKAEECEVTRGSCYGLWGLEGSFIVLVKGGPKRSLEPFFVGAINKQTSETNECSHSLMRALLLLP